MFYYNIETNLNNNSNIAFAWLCFTKKNEKTILEFANKSAKQFDCVVQLIDARNISSKQHVIISAFLTLKAFENKVNFSKDLGLEVLLRSSARKNIKDAIELMGVKENQNTYVAIAFGKSCKDAVSFLASEAIGSKEVEEQKPSQETMIHLMDVFEVSFSEIKSIAQNNGFEEEYNALCKLIFEKIALLDLER